MVSDSGYDPMIPDGLWTYTDASDAAVGKGTAGKSVGILKLVE